MNRQEISTAVLILNIKNLCLQPYATKYNNSFYPRWILLLLQHKVPLLNFLFTNAAASTMNTLEVKQLAFSRFQQPWHNYRGACRRGTIDSQSVVVGQRIFRRDGSIKRTDSNESVAGLIARSSCRSAIAATRTR